MAVQDMLGHCLEASLAEKQHSPIKEQWQKGGKLPRVIAALRCLPERPRLALISAVSADTMPVANIDKKPLAYGYQSVVHRTESGLGVIKRLHGTRQTTPSDLLSEQLRLYKLYQDCFGDQVLPTSFFLAGSQYHSGNEIIASYQPLIEGASLFDDLGAARQSEVYALQAGTQKMIGKYACVPDFGGDGNVLVDSAGLVHIVDSGGVALPNEIPERSQAFRDHLAMVVDVTQLAWAS